MIYNNFSKFHLIFYQQKISISSHPILMNVKQLFQLELITKITFTARNMKY